MIMMRRPSWAAVFGLRQHLRQSLWAVPLLGTAVGAALAVADLRLEGQIPLPAGWSYSAATATALLSAVAGQGAEDPGFALAPFEGWWNASPAGCADPESQTYVRCPERRPG